MSNSPEPGHEQSPMSWGGSSPASGSLTDAQIAALQPGTKIMLTVVRAGRTQNEQVTLAQRTDGTG